MTLQFFLHVRRWKRQGAMFEQNVAEPIRVPHKPDRVFTLYEDQLWGAPFLPQHKINCHLEDEGHDWNWRAGTLRYFSRLSNGPCVLLLEYDKPDSEPKAPVCVCDPPSWAPVNPEPCPIHGRPS